MTEALRRDRAGTTVDIGGLLTRGAVAGFSSGLAFILANMWFAASAGKPPVGPFLAISTIFHGSPMPQMSPANVVVGVTTHSALSIAFGLGFAILVGLIPMLRQAPILLGAALIYGLGLYVLNFQILGRVAFTWFTNPQGPNQIFELIIHPVIFGLLLTPFFLGWARRNDQG